MTSLQRVLGLLWASKDRAQGMAILHNEMHDGDESEMMPASDAACAGGLVVPGQLFTLPRQRDTVETPDRRPFGSSMTRIQKNQNPESIVLGGISTLTCPWPLADPSTQAMWWARPSGSPRSAGRQAVSPPRRTSSSCSAQRSSAQLDTIYKLY